MKNLIITSLSSRGQVVIPLGVREKLHLSEGEKFVIVGENDTIILKKLEMPSFKGFDELLRKTRETVKKQGINQSDVEDAIRRVRHK
ncbi:MAG TPA: AbrB/MazE/SpoVT family DNA-binding domain-containing protein [Candidatus Nanoarchaeia archaeon]|nr:AbrB/MazE/SpoVT family DNA-binding domain-containing protein [Candidatus Nanoarchaeia archaeon]